MQLTANHQAGMHPQDFQNSLTLTLFFKFQRFSDSPWPVRALIMLDKHLATHVEVFSEVCNQTI